MSEQSAGPERTDRSKAQRRRILLWVGAALLVVLVAVVLIAFLARGGSTEGAAPTPDATQSAGSATPTPTGSSTATPDAGAPTGPTEAPEEPEQPGAEAEGPEGTEEDPVPFDDSHEAVPGVTVAVGELSAVEGEPRGAGELAGPALRFTVDVTNTGTETASLESLVVNLYSGEDASPAPSVSGPNAFNVPAEVAPGATVTGAYVFTVPENERDTVRIAVDYSTEAEIVVFEGSAPQ